MVNSQSVFIVGFTFSRTLFWARLVLKTATIIWVFGQLRANRAGDYNSTRESSRMTVGRSVNRNFFSPVITGLFTIEIKNIKAGIPLQVEVAGTHSKNRLILRTEASCGSFSQRRERIFFFQLFFVSTIY